MPMLGAMFNEDDELPVPPFDKLQYRPTYIQIDKTDLHTIFRALNCGIENTKELLQQAKDESAQTAQTRRVREWVVLLESDLRLQQAALETIKGSL